MNWATVRNKFPDQWVLLEAIEAHSTDGKRIVDRVSVINTYDEGKKALQEYKLIHKK